MILEYFRIALRNLSHRKLRSWLTMLGVFIAIASIVALVSLGQGLQEGVNKEFEKLGTDKLIIQPAGGAFAIPGETSAIHLTEKDADVVKKVKGVNIVATLLSRTARIGFKDQVGFYFVSGLPLDEGRKVIEEIQNFEVVEGRDLRKGDKFKAVIGNDYTKKEVFDKTLSVGDNIEINGKKFSVVGIMGRIGNPIDDRSLLIPLDTMKELFNTGDVVDYMFLKLDKGADVEAVSKEVERKLRNFRGLKEGQEDFEVQSPVDLLNTFLNVFNIIQIVVIGIAAISLLVGAVGIMNTMYTAVLERTREIGVMKAIGARNSSILFLFIIESGFLGMVGGVIGVVLGFGISKSVEFIAVNYFGFKLLQVPISPFLLLGGILFGFVIGALSGAVPAYQASRQNPVDSLRYE